MNANTHLDAYRTAAKLFTGNLAQDKNEFESAILSMFTSFRVQGKAQSKSKFFSKTDDDFLLVARSKTEIVWKTYNETKDFGSLTTCKGIKSCIKSNGCNDSNIKYIKDSACPGLLETLGFPELKDNQIIKDWFDGICTVTMNAANLMIQSNKPKTLSETRLKAFTEMRKGESQKFMDAIEKKESWLSSEIIDKIIASINQNRLADNLDGQARSIAEKYINFISEDDNDDHVAYYRKSLSSALNTFKNKYLTINPPLGLVKV